MPQKLRKILVKVVRGDDLKWIHFCYIPAALYEQFFAVTKCEKSAFGTFLSLWALGDFSIPLKMTTYNDIRQLRNLVIQRYMEEYPEFYETDSDDNPRVCGWMKMWVSQHMRVEIAARIGEENVQ